MVVESSSLRSVCELMDVVSVPNFSSSLSSRSFMDLERCRSVTRGLELVVLCIAWTLSAMASRTGAWARRMAVLLGSVPSMLPRCGMKSMRLPKIYTDLWSHSV